MTPHAGWHALGLADDVPPGTSTGTCLFGRELVVWRDEAGGSHVWEDRCPHRGTRLSFGFVRGNHIACLYHGWQFDVAGRCRFIPAHPQLDVPETITVERLASVERLGLVWAFVGDDAAGTPPPPDAPATMPVRSVTVNAPAEVVVDVLRRVAPPGGCGTAPDADAAGRMLTFGAAGGSIHVAVQSAQAHETVLHLVTERGDDRPGISRWAEAVRRHAETRVGEPV